MATITMNQGFNPNSEKSIYDFTQGIQIDMQIAAQEVEVQKAWANALVATNIIDQKEADSICTCLDEALALINSGKFEWSVEDEDIHMNLESFLTKHLGDLGKRLHTGRSRNDLIATTLRLFTKDEIATVSESLRQLAGVLAERAEKDVDCILPGLTHLQAGQPLRHGHVLASHGWSFARDLKRLNHAKERCMEEMPLGAAALTGTTIDIDLSALAKSLGFQSPNWNSYNAVGDRDFIIETLDSLASVAVHCSRLAEDCILWSSTAFSIVNLPMEWSTGSSIMPNKRNPDVAELVRAKSAHIIAAAANGHALLKGLPSSYISDLHELKSVLLNSLKETKAILRYFPELISRLEPNRERMQELLAQGNILATEVANHLSSNGVVFRDAYAQTAMLVKRANELNLSVENLPKAEWEKIAPKLDENFMTNLDFTAAVEQRKLQGGTSLASAKAGIEALKREIAWNTTGTEA